MATQRSQSAIDRLSRIINHFVMDNTSNINYVSEECKSYTLTDCQRAFYEKNGYLIVRGLLNQYECDELNNRFNEYVLNPSIRPAELVIMRDIALPHISNKKNKVLSPMEVTKIQNVGNDEIYLKYHLKNAKIINYIRSFIGDDIRGLNYMHISKPPDIGSLSSRHPLHQDLWYYPLNNQHLIIAAWTALEYVGRMNGGLSVVPGTHKNGLYIHEYPNWDKVNFKYLGVNKEIYNKYARKRIHLEMNPGDTVFFHPFLIHGSGANLSNNTRKIIVTHFLNSKKVNFVDFKYKEQDPAYYEQNNQHKLGGTLGFKQNKKIDIKKVLEMNGIKRIPFLQLASKQICGDVGHWKLSDKEIKFWQKYYFKRNVDESNWK